MDKLASLINKYQKAASQSSDASKARKHSTNETWLLAEKIATLLADPTDGPEKKKELTLRWLRNAKHNQWEIMRAYADLGEATNIRNRAALFLYLYKKYVKLAKEQKKTAS